LISARNVRGLTLLAADEAQPIEALLGAETDAMPLFVHLAPNPDRDLTGSATIAYNSPLQSGERPRLLFTKRLQTHG
jgi:hypothetical protein